jgi:hypothetical protein
MELTKKAILARFMGNHTQAADYCYGIAYNGKLSLETREEYRMLMRFFLVGVAAHGGN